MEIKENVLYFTQNTGKVSKIDIISPLSNPNNSSEESILLYPNPSRDVLKFTGIDESKSYSYTIYNSVGLKIKEGIITDNDSIKIYNLRAGLYLIKFKAGPSKRFLKF